MKAEKFFIQKGRKMVLVKRVHPTTKTKGGKITAKIRAERKAHKYGLKNIQLEY